MATHKGNTNCALIGLDAYDITLAEDRQTGSGHSCSNDKQWLSTLKLQAYDSKLALDISTSFAKREYEDVE